MAMHSLAVLMRVKSVHSRHNCEGRRGGLVTLKKKQAVNRIWQGNSRKNILGGSRHDVVLDTVRYKTTEQLCDCSSKF